MIESRKPSLRNILLVTFIPLSVLPLIAALVWSYYAYESGIRMEIARRGRLEIDQFRHEIFVARFELQRRAEIHSQASGLFVAIMSGKSEAIQSQLESLSAVTQSSCLAVYNRSGKKWAMTGECPNLTSKQLGQNSDIISHSKSVFIVSSRAISSPVGRAMGYFVEAIELDQDWVKRVSDRVSDNLIFLSIDGTLLGTTLSEKRRLAYKNLNVKLPPENEPTQIQRTMLQFQPLATSTGQFVGYIGVADSTEGISEVLHANNVWILIVSVVSILIITGIAIMATRKILRPLRALVEASEDLKVGQPIDDLPEAMSSEIDDLRAAFLEMAQGVLASKEILEVKLQELQEANQSIRNAQSQVVQSAKMAGLGQLVAGVAHELNNPIGFIHANMFHLKEYCVTLFKYIAALEKQAELPELKKEMDIAYIRKDLFDLIKSCREGAQRTKDIVQGLKTFSRIDEAQLKEVDIPEGVKSTLQILRAELKNVKVSLKFPENFPKVSCFASQMNQVWLNLILNGAHAMQPKGGEILVSGETQGEQVVVKVQDFGSGIDPENLDKIFEPFFTTKDIGKGTGLGLSICYNVVQRHGGSIAVQSQVGKGTTFTVTLPLKPPTLQKMPRPMKA